MKKYIVIYEKRIACGFNVEAPNEEIAKIVADNLQRKSNYFDFSHDAVVHFNTVVLDEIPNE